MSFQFLKLTPANGSVAVYQLKEFLKTHGWEVLSSSDGTTYNAAGDQITAAGSGAGGMANNAAWFRIRNGSAGAPELTWQRSTNLNWRVKFSQLAGFVGGAPGATQTPSATDEAIVVGSGSDAAPGYAALLSTDNTYHFLVGAEASGQRRLWCVTYDISGLALRNTLVLDRVAHATPTDTGLYVVGHVQGLTPSTFGVDTSGGALWTTRPSATAGAPLRCSACFIGNNTGPLPGVTSANPITARDELTPVVYARRSNHANGFYKGVSTMLKWTGVPRANCDTLSLDSARDHIVFPLIALPWDGSAPPV